MFEGDLGGNLDKAEELREIDIAPRVFVNVLVRTHLEDSDEFPILHNLHPHNLVMLKLHLLQCFVGIKDVAKKR